MIKKIFYCFLIYFFIATNSYAQFVQQGTKLVGAGTIGQFSYQGRATAISGDGNTMIVGGYRDNNFIGAAWIYIRQGNTWVQQGNKLIPNDNIGQARFGVSASLSYDGNTLIIGGTGDNAYSGAAWIFTRNNNIWSQKQKLTMLDPAGDQQYFGQSVSIAADGNTAIIGANQDNTTYGAACIFTQSNGSWSQQGSKLVPVSNDNDNGFGYSVSICANGNTVAIGNNRDKGAIVYSKQNGVWTQQGNPLKGNDANGKSSYQGYQVAISGDGSTIIEGGYWDDPVGAAWIFTLSGGVWKQQGTKLVGSNSIVNGPFSHQGSSVALSYDGNIAVVGSYTDNNNTGAIWYFSRTNGVWTEQQKIIPNDPSGTLVHFGDWGTCSISWDGNIIVVGGDRNANDLGAAWIFKNTPLEVCSRSNKTFTSNIAGNTYQWQVDVNDGNGFINISNDANYAGATTLSIQLNNIPSSWNGYKYRCIINGGANYSCILTLKISSYWNGTINNKWEEEGNWSCGRLPDKYTDVYINSGVPNYPVVETISFAKCKSLTISPGASFKVNANKNIRIYGH